MASRGGIVSSGPRLAGEQGEGQVPHRFEYVRGRRYVEVLTLTLVLMALAFLLLLASPRDAFAQALPKADYRFQNNVKTSVGTAPTLTKIGPKSNTFTTATVDGDPRKVLRFPKGNGLKLDTTGLLSSNGIYTIVVLLELDDVSNFKRIVDFKNGTSDNGLYVQNGGPNGGLRFYPWSASGTTPIAANRYVQVVITRDLSGIVRGYVDGSQQFQFDDAASQDAVISSEDNLRFFKDNTSGGTTGEDSGGSVARIRLFDVALSGTDVGRLDRLEPTVFRVNSNADVADGNLVDGKCLTVNPNECTLRAAIQQSNETSGSDTINFASTVTGTITLGLGELVIDNEPDSLTIDGPGARVLAVSGNNASRVFRLSDDASAAINNLRISNGNAANLNGGGISTDGDLLALTNVTVSGNQAASGGGIYNSGNVLKLSKTTVGGGNRATNGVGGGIYNNIGGALTLNNSTVSGNQASSGLDLSSGGGIANGGALTLINVTVSGNRVDNGDGGGIRNLSGTTSSRNTIVANNTAATGPDASGTFASQGNNLIGNSSGAAGFGGTDILGRNPLLGPLQDNGGSTDTHALLSRSPAIDKGTNSGCPRTDQRGETRPMDGDGKGKAICDIGSFEKRTVRR